MDGIKNIQIWDGMCFECVCLSMCVCVCGWRRMLLLSLHNMHTFLQVFVGASASHTHSGSLTERQRSSIHGGITCHGECLSGGELEPVLGESAGISPLAAQSSTAQQHKPGQAQKVGQPETHACTYAQTHKHTRTAKIDAALVSRCGCI